MASAAEFCYAHAPIKHPETRPIRLSTGHRVGTGPPAHAAIHWAWRIATWAFNMQKSYSSARLLSDRNIKNGQLCATRFVGRVEYLPKTLNIETPYAYTTPRIKTCESATHPTVIRAWRPKRPILRDAIHWAGEIDTETLNIETPSAYTDHNFQNSDSPDWRQKSSYGVSI